VDAVARSKNQEARREQLAEAALRMIADRGLGNVRVKDIADDLGISPRLVAYYYPELDDLIDDVYRSAVDRYYWQRLAAIEQLEDATSRLVRLVTSGLPTGGIDLLSRALYELAVNAARNPLHATLLTLLYDREVSLYVAVLEAGRASGAFTLAEPVLSVAKNLVALEDAFGLHINGGNSSLDPHAAEGLLRSYARSATGAPI